MVVRRPSLSPWTAVGPGPHVKWGPTIKWLCRTCCGGSTPGVGNWLGHQGARARTIRCASSACKCENIPCVCVHARLWTHVLLPCGCSPQLSLCPPFLLGPEETRAILPSEGWLRFKTTGLSRSPVFPSRLPSTSSSVPSPTPARPAIQRGFTEPPPGTSTVGPGSRYEQQKERSKNKFLKND